MDPEQASELAPLSMGQLYPLGDILAVIDDRAQAERAVQALKDAGLPGGDVDLIDGAWFAQALRHIKGRRNLIERVVAALAEEEEIARQYVEQAEQGHTIIVVHAATSDVRGGVLPVLTQHGAHHIQHYGQLVITAPPLPERATRGGR
jgi:hypothetical protein